MVSNDDSRAGIPDRADLHVVVVGAGMAGICAARALAAAGARVTVLEAGPQVGGCLRTTSFAGQAVDAGAEAVHTAAPGPLQLMAELGLGAEQVEARRTVTWIATRNGLRPLPGGVGPAGPTRIGPLVRSGLLSPRGLARAALEPLVPATRADDDAVGAVLTRRFGRQVVERIVDPLLGGLHAGDVDRLSVRAATPQLATLLADHRSVVLAGGRRRGGSGTGFVTLPGGLQRLAAAAAAPLDGAVQTGVRVTSITDIGSAGACRYRVETDAGARHAADAVVVAVPPASASQALAALDPELPALLSAFRAASVASVFLAYPTDAAHLPALAGTGVLVPSTSPQLLKAATFLSSKWPHLTDGSHVLVRASVGRAGDERHRSLDEPTLVARVAAELHDLVGLPTTPLRSQVVRWDHAMPQLEVGHHGRVAEVRRRLRRSPGIVLAGAAYDGVGVASAMRSGAAAAAALLPTREDVTT